MRRSAILAGFLLLMLGLTACKMATTAEKRARKAENGKGDVVIGLVDTQGSYSFRRGAEMAIEEVNRQGGFGGRRLSPIFEDDHGSEERGRQIAERLTQNTDVVAVIGHINSSVAIPASITYYDGGLLFLSPGALLPSFTRYGFWTSFRNIVSSDEIARQMAAFAAQRKFLSVAVVYARDADVYKFLAQSFQEQAVKRAITIPATRSYFPTDGDFRALLADVAEEDVDAVFLVGALPAAATLIKQAREMGIDAPFLGGSGLDGLELLHVAGNAANGTIVPTIFSPQQPIKVTQDFVDRFEATFGMPPSTWEAQGYDAVQVLAAAMRASHSTVPRSVGMALQFMKRWEGVTGAYTFTNTGDIQGKQVFFKEVRNGEFTFLATDVERALQIDPSKVVTDVTIRIPLETRLDTLDPGKSNSEASYEVIDQLFMALTTFDQTSYAAVPELAERWEMSADGLTYTFYLREGVVWTDGTPVTAHDVVWALRRNLDPATQSPNVARLYVLKNAQTLHQQPTDDMAALGVRALDDLTVEFTLEYPVVYFPKLLDLPIYRPLPRHVIETHGATWTHSGNIQTNAAYELSLWQRGVVTILRKNPTYFQADSVSIPEVRYYIIASPIVGLAMYKNNELDVLGSAYLPLPAAELAKVRSDPVVRDEYSQQQKSCTNALVLNPAYPLNNLAARRAIAHLVDRQFILDFVLRGQGQPSGTLLPPGAAEQTTEVDIFNQFSPEHARLWLEQAGYTEGGEFPAISFACPDSQPEAEILRILRDTIEYESGLTTECVSSPQIRPHVTLLRKCSDYPDASSVLEDFHPERAEPLVRWDYNSSSAKFAELVERARVETDSSERDRLYTRAERILTQHDALVLPLYIELAPSLVKPRIQGWHHNVQGGQYIRNWRFQE